MANQHMRREEIDGMAASAEYLSSRLSLNPTPVELESAVSLLLGMRVALLGLFEQFDALHKAARYVTDEDQTRQPIDLNYIAVWKDHWEALKHRVEASSPATKVPHQGDYEPPEVDDWRPGDHRPSYPARES